jgi:hypothetical protein
MAEAITKARILTTQQAEQAQWDLLLADIGEAHMTQPGVTGTWSIKDTLAHLNGWNRQVLAHFEAQLRQEPTPASEWPADLHEDDEINAWLVSQAHGHSLTEELAGAQDIWRRLFAALDACSAEDLATPARFTWTEGQPISGADFFTYFHGHFHDDHEPDMRAWLEKLHQSAE